MQTPLYTFKFELNWTIVNQLSKVDRFDASWSAIEKRESQTLKQLKSIATVRSVAASTRIEGSRMSDDEVEVLISRLDVAKLDERDEQEVAGYFETLELISESYADIEVSENSIKNLHKLLMHHSTKDEWHRGDYKKHSNTVEATHSDGSKQIIFHTTAPGFPTEDAMISLINWYRSDATAHSVVKAAAFVYDFLSIHPFQDGNGRLSRLLATLLLLKQGYTWIQYVSFEHEIEFKKGEYYKHLMQCQRERPGENIFPWVKFFLECLSNIQDQLLQKLNVQGSIAAMGPREKSIYVFIENNPGCKSGRISEKLGIPLPTVKRILSEMIGRSLINKHGIGPGTNYSL